MTDAEIEAALFRDAGRHESATRAAIGYAHVHAELSRPGVTLQLLWFEYQESVAARGDERRPASCVFVEVVRKKFVRKEGRAYGRHPTRCRSRRRPRRSSTTDRQSARDERAHH